METPTQTIQAPPPKVPAVATTFEDDYIRIIGDRIAILTPQEAEELNEYLKHIHGITPSGEA